MLTLIYELGTVRLTYALIKYKSIAVANISVGVGAIGMACVVVYNAELNTTIPILASTWVANYYAVERAKKKQEKELCNGYVTEKDDSK